MDHPPILFQNIRGIELAHFSRYWTRDKKLWQNSIFAIFENEPEMTLRPNIKNFLNLKVSFGPHNNLTQNESIFKENSCLKTAVCISGSTSKL